MNLNEILTKNLNNIEEIVTNLEQIVDQIDLSKCWRTISPGNYNCVTINHNDNKYYFEESNPDTSETNGVVDINFIFKYNDEKLFDSSFYPLDVNKKSVVLKGIYNLSINIIEKKLDHKNKVDFEHDNYNKKIYKLCNAFKNISDALNELTSQFNYKNFRLKTFDEKQKYVSDLLGLFLYTLASDESNMYKVVLARQDLNEDRLELEIILQNREQQLQSLFLKVDKKLTNKNKIENLTISTSHEDLKNNQEMLHLSSHLEDLDDISLRYWDHFSTTIYSYIESIISSENERKLTLETTSNKIEEISKSIKWGAPTRDMIVDKQEESLLIEVNPDDELSDRIIEMSPLPHLLKQGVTLSSMNKAYSSVFC